MLKSDHEIRVALRERLEKLYPEDTDTLIKSEMSLAKGGARIGLAVIGDQLLGYDFKSRRDDLNELYGQVSAFSGVFDQVVALGESEIVERMEKIVPEWWGLQAVIIGGDRELRFHTVREPLDNPEYDDFAIAQLLWKDEILAHLAGLGVDLGRGVPRIGVLSGMLLDEVKPAELRALVRETLKTREGWTSQAIPGSSLEGHRLRRVSRPLAFV